MVEIRYKCKCTKEEQTLFILERSEGENIEHYMAYMQGQIGAHHFSLNPKCRQTKMKYAKLHIGANGSIGSAPVKQ